MRRTGRIESKECGWDAPGVARVPEALQCLDPSDRKFAAVALAYTPPVPVLNAVDPDWWQCAEACAAVGLVVEELCPEALEQGT
ncbi:MAG: hypothetical protein FJX74_11745 [Armatimonadetes bacterium]|nr:hypothetical protein [Armatimonadota bacterium]